MRYNGFWESEWGERAKFFGFTGFAFGLFFMIVTGINPLTVLMILFVGITAPLVAYVEYKKEIKSKKVQ